MFRTVVVLLALALVPAAQAAPFDAASRFQPHKAVYELSLARDKSQSDYVAGYGRLDVALGDACQGWTTKQRARVYLAMEEGPQIDFGWSLSSWEAKDGLRYRFVMQRFDGDEPNEELSGDASLSRIGGGGEAHFTEPTTQQVTLPPGTIFPTWHGFEIVNLLERNPQATLFRTVFDGTSEPEGYSPVSAIGAGPATAPRDLENPLLTDQRSWQGLLAYFSPTPGEGLPEHEQVLRVYENGVVGAMVFDFGDFSLKAKLVELSALPKPDC